MSRTTTVSITDNPAPWLTQDAYDRLKNELDHMLSEGRSEITQRIEAAREEGDLRENGGYHAAKEEQGKQEARIRQLQQLLENAQVGEPPADDGVVEPGMYVTVELTGETMSFLLGSREAAPDNVEVYSEKSPMGSAIIGLTPGQETTFIAPNGKQLSIKVIKAKPYQETM